MNEISHLKSMWGPRVRRSTELILSPDESEWSYFVSHIFNDALDIKYQERIEDKKLYMVWTQGPYLDFKEGYIVYSKDGKSCVQVDDAEPMAWDSKKSEMCEGSIAYSKYTINKGIYTKLHSESISQMEFLTILIHGEG